MVFAEMDTLTTAVIAIISTASLGGIVTAVVQLGKSWRDGKKEGRVDALAEWAKIHELDRLTIDRIDKAATEASSREQECERRCSMLEGRVEYLTGLMEDKGIKVRPWKAEVGSASHTPIPHTPIPPVKGAK